MARGGWCRGSNRLRWAGENLYNRVPLALFNCTGSASQYARHIRDTGRHVKPHAESKRDLRRESLSLHPAGEAIKSANFPAGQLAQRI